MAHAENQQRISRNADSSIAVYTGPPGARGTSGPYWGFQYRFVKQTAKHTVGLAVTTANELIIGVLQNKPQHLSEAAEVAISGVSLIQLGGTVAAGDGIKVDSTGRGVAATPGTDAALIVAVADDAGTVGKVIPALLRMN